MIGDLQALEERSLHFFAGTARGQQETSPDALDFGEGPAFASFFCNLEGRQHACADVVSILIAVLRMLAWVAEVQRPFKVLAADDELAHGKIGCAQRAVRQAERGGVAVALGFADEIQCRVPLQAHLPADVVACPNSVEDRELLRRIRGFIDQPLGAQQNFLGFRSMAFCAKMETCCARPCSVSHPAMVFIALFRMYPCRCQAMRTRYLSLQL